MTPLLTLATLGFFISLYATLAHYKAKKDNGKMICDINDRISCTKAFMSKYGEFLGVSNGVWGMLTYIMVIFLALYAPAQWLWYLSLFLVVYSFMMAYILVKKVKTICLVCFAVYAVNLGLFLIMMLEMGFL